MDENAKALYAGIDEGFLTKRWKEVRRWNRACAMSDADAVRDPPEGLKSGVVVYTFKENGWVVTFDRKLPRKLWQPRTARNDRTNCHCTCPEAPFINYCKHKFFVLRKEGVLKDIVGPH